MRAPISVLIPTLNAESTLPECLAALAEGLSTGLIRELVISDGGSSDATRQIAEEVGAIWVSGAPSRGGQLRRGAEAAGGDWLLVIHADSVLAPGWSDPVQQAIATPGACYFQLRFDGGGLAARLVAGWANLRARLFARPFGDQGLLIDRASYDAAGGYPDIPLMEDVALARALGRNWRALPHDIKTSAEKYQKQGWVKRGARNLQIQARYALGADPKDLAQAYRR
jgi:rSAM/selenodomain-associated transferase 2